MKSRAAKSASQLLTQASATLLTNKPLGTELFLCAERMLTSVPDPIDYLALTMRADVIVRRHFLPAPGTP